MHFCRDDRAQGLGFLWHSSMSMHWPRGPTLYPGGQEPLGPGVTLGTVGVVGVTLAVTADTLGPWVVDRRFLSHL